MTNSDTPSGANLNSKPSGEKGPRSFEDEGITLKDLICSYIRDIRETKPSSPISPSLNHTEHHSHPCPVENLIRLLPNIETHLRRGTCNHGRVCHHIPDTSHYSSSDSSQDTSGHARTASHRNNTWLESYEQTLCLILNSILERPESSDLTASLFRALSSLLSIPSLECRVEQHVGHIRIRFLDGNHQSRVHLSLIHI